MFKKGKKLSPKTMTHRFSGKEVDDRIEIDGSFDVNLWYSYDNDTKTSVITKNIPYKEMVTVAQKETTDSSSKDIIVRSLKQPSCISATWRILRMPTKVPIR